jgi:hypothetical protein
MLLQQELVLEDIRKFKEAELGGYEKGKAEASLEINELKEQINKLKRSSDYVAGDLEIQSD